MSSASLPVDFCSLHLTNQRQHTTFRRRYEKGHWDAVISDYKEVELGSDLSPLSVQALERCKHRLLSRHLKPTSTFLPCHAIDLKQAGQLTAHVDSIKFSGTMVAGLSLLSSSIMRLRVEDRFVDLLLPPRSLYVLTGKSRYEYTHELLPCGSTFTRGDDGSERQIKREQRVSIIFRDAKVE
jgi:alkylated DNA repair protein alkB homolog 7